MQIHWLITIVSEMKTYKEFLITTEPFAPEMVSSILWELNILGVNEDVNCIKVYATDPDLKETHVREALQRLKDEKMIFNYNVELNVYEDQNWNEEWEKTINVIEVSDKIIIKPTFREHTAKPGQLVITIDPKMSFGTGEHQTTKLCLLLIDKYIKPGMKMLDVGTGTAVLPIAAVKLGASYALGIDNDEWCLDNGLENCQLNYTGDKVEIRTGEIKDVSDKDFDLITANIQKNILLDIAADILLRLKNKGVLILSGLLKEDEEDVKSAYSSLGLEFIETQTMEAWIALVFNRP